jgi:hypothetical protein
MLPATIDTRDESNEVTQVEELMNKYEMLLAQARTYNMLAKATRSNLYLVSARDCLEKLKDMLKNDVTRTISYNSEVREK